MAAIMTAMKQTFLITFLMLSTAINAQKIKNVNCGDFHYSLPALNIQLQKCRSYFLEVDVLDGNEYDAFEVRRIAELCNLIKVDSAGLADVILKYTITPISFNTPQLREVRLSDGIFDTTEDESIYVYTGNYSYSIHVQLIDSGGQIIYDNFDPIVTKVIRRRSSQSALKARQIYDAEADQINAQYVANETILMNGEMNELYCALDTSVELSVLRVKPKIYEYDGFNQASERLVTLTSERDEQKRIVGLEEVISDLESELIEGDEETPTARINADVLAAGNYNIAVAYFIMSEYDLAGIYLREAIQYGKFLRNEEYLQMKFIEDHMRRFNRSRNPR